MTKSMKRKLRRLIDAIHGAISDSEEITRSLAGVREEGYDLFLVLEAAVVLNRQQDGDDDDDDPEDDDLDFDEDEDFDDDSDDLDEDEDLDDEDDDEEAPLEFQVAGRRRTALELSPKDVEFLKGLRIRCD
jgi:hypothetical protein